MALEGIQVTPLPNSDSETSDTSSSDCSDCSDSEGSSSHCSECSESDSFSTDAECETSKGKAPQVKPKGNEESEEPRLPYSVGRPPAKGFRTAGKALLQKAAELDKRIQNLQKRKLELTQKGDEYVTNGEAWDNALKAKRHKKLEEIKAKTI